MKDLSVLKALLLQEIDEAEKCNECGGLMEKGMCTECGYMEELTKGQEKIDVAEPKGKITAADFAALRAKKNMKEGELKLGVKYDLDGETGFISTGGSEDPSNWKFLGDKGKYAYLSVKDRLVPSKEQPGKYDGAFNDNPGGYILPEKEGKDNHNFEVDDIVKVKATGKKGKIVDMSPSETFFIVNIEGKKSSFHGSDLELIKRPSLNETEDHEVSMAHNSLESIIKSAMELKMKLGDNEKDIPAWIQDHITNAENYINQASKNYHEYSNGEHDMDELPDGTVELPAGDEEDAQMTLQGLMEDLFEAKKVK
jgi:hypothetical protein